MKQFWLHFEWFLALFHISDEKWLLSDSCKQCGLFCLLGRDQKIEMKLGCENIMSQNTIVQRIGLIERLTF